MENKNLQQSISDCIQEELNKGIIEEVLREQFKKCVEKSVEDLFSYCGSVREVIKKRIDETLVPYLESYNYDAFIPKLDCVLTDVLKSVPKDYTSIIENFKDMCDLKKMPEVITEEHILDAYSKYVKENIDVDLLDFNCEDVFYVEIGLEKNESDESYSTSSSPERYIINLSCDENGECGDNLDISFSIYKYDFMNHFRIDKTSVRSLNDFNSLRKLNNLEILLLKIIQYDIPIDIKKDYANMDVEIEREY